ERRGGMRRPAMQPDQAVEKLVLAYRLVQPCVDKGSESLADAITSCRCNKNELRSAERMMRTDSRGQFLAGHSRHHLIEEYNVVRLSAVPGTFKLREAVESVSGSRGLDAVSAELAT